VLLSVCGCHTLSAPICEAITNISDGGTSRYIFGATFNGAKPEENTICRMKKMLKIFQDYPQFVGAMIRIEKISFREEKLNALELTKYFERFRPI